MSMFEKRRYQRLPVSLPVTLRYQGRLIPATMLNLSCGGACIRSDASDLNVDAPVEIIFDLNARDNDVSMRGRVVHAADADDGCTAGIRFSNLFSDGHRTIQEFLRKQFN